MKHNIPLVLFAGGKSSRMGRDKTLLPFAGYNSMTEYQYQRLSSYFETVYISCKHHKFDFEAPCIFDRYEESSPLVGMVSLFETLEDEALFILSVDAPFVNKEVIDTLIKNATDFDVTIAKTESGRQPLCGVYKRKVLPIAKAHIEANSHKIGKVLQEVKTKMVDFEDDRLFANLNHPHEYEEALSRLT